MRKIFFSLATASAIAMTVAPAQAQRGGVLVVDVDKILTDCNACRSAATQLQTQATQFRQRQQALEAQLKPEADALQKAAAALGNKQPDAALQQRATAFRTKQQQAQTELQNRGRALESTQAHVQQQIGERLTVVSEQVRARRQGGVVIPKSALLATDPSVDVTADVLAALNAALPSVSVTPLPQAQQPQSQPQGR